MESSPDMNFHSSVRVALMPERIDDYRFIFNRKQYSIIPDTQAILRGIIGEPFDIGQPNNLS